MTPIIPEIYDENGKRIWGGVKARRAYLADKVCVECGSADSLQFHHRDPSDRTDDVNFSRSDERILAEIAKCDLLCRECHAKKHAMRHGTTGMYTAGRCRCDMCTSNWRVYNREYKRDYRRKKKLANS